ncbi:complexed with cef1p [Maudiozyma exigua]|uniref:Complexed with cef1p n=1 Tax=Maudiozyma exigua TaxID=34358 RepID=A0A9P6W578_MAUEX|nr:complexed with cef1p [Kazachstania exigua]
MSTSHRPQLESRSGAKAAGYTSTSIEHARSLPGHKTIKYRVTEPDVIRSEDEDKIMIADENQKHKNTEDTVKKVVETNEQDTTKSLIKISKEQRAKYSVSKPVPKNKGWRSSTTFSRNRNDKSKGEKDEYVNNITKSSYHQDFIRKITK